MPRPIHFEIHAANPQRAIDFYTKLFGWQFSQWGTEQYWLVKTGEASEPGIDGGLLLRRGDAPAEMAAVNAYVCTIGVDNLLLCRRSLDEATVHDLTQQFFVQLPSMSILSGMDLEQAPATPIPLHDGAARYYRERELSR